MARHDASTRSCRDVRGMFSIRFRSADSISVSALPAPLCFRIVADALEIENASSLSATISISRALFRFTCVPRSLALLVRRMETARRI